MNNFKNVSSSSIDLSKLENDTRTFSDINKLIPQNETQKKNLKKAKKKGINIGTVVYFDNLNDPKYHYIVNGIRLGKYCGIVNDIPDSVVVSLKSSFSNQSWDANSKRLKVVNNIYDVEQLSLF